MTSLPNPPAAGPTRESRVDSIASVSSAGSFIEYTPTSPQQKPTHTPHFGLRHLDDDDDDDFEDMPLPEKTHGLRHRRVAAAAADADESSPALPRPARASEPDHPIPIALPSHAWTGTALEDALIALRIAAMLLFLVAVVALGYFVRDDAGARAAAWGLVVIGLVGLAASLAVDPKGIGAFGALLYLWAVAVTSRVVYFVSTNGTRRFAQERCAYTEFAARYGDPITPENPRPCQGNAALICYEHCVHDVEQDLDLITTGVAVVLVVAALALGRFAIHAARHVPRT